MKILIASSKEWHRTFANRLKKETGFEIVYVNDPQILTIQYVQSLRPQYLFFPHWSYIIPEGIYMNFECVIFHMTDVPFGRGGSPLQNLISRGIYATKLSALRCGKVLDGGPVYLKKDLSLYGSAEEIYLRSAKLSFEMMVEIIQNEIKPAIQTGQAVFFKRRTPVESDISQIKELEKIFDYIRMLDAEGYPRAFIETENLHLEFDRASLKDGYIQADVKIKLKDFDDEK